MEEYSLEEGKEIRIPSLFFEREDNSEIKEVYFYNCKIERIDEDDEFIYIDSEDEESYLNGQKLPLELVQSWQFRPYIKDNK